MRFAILAFTLSALLYVDSVALAQTVQDEIGFTELAAELGASLPDGSGLTAAIVEAPRANGEYLPNVDSAQFSGKTITDGSGTNSAASSHATSVGTRFFGNTGSIASGINNITGFDANDYLVRVLGAGDGSDPLADLFDITNHSYIANGVSEADQFAILSRFDFVTNRDNTVAVVGANNRATNATPDLLAPAYNAITVGRTDGDHSQTLTAGYGETRNKPDIVAPESTASNATPWVSSAAGLLLDAGQGTNATQNEVVRAIIFAGATKEEFADWDRTTTRPIDETFGVGELNIYNSYQIQQGGQFMGSPSEPASAVGENGWDFQENFETGDELFYEFSVGEGEVLNDLSIVLSWNALITDVDASADAFVPLLDVADLSLELYDSDGGFLDTLVDSSDSPFDNVEHIWIPTGLTEGTYHLRVANASTNSIATDFALAFRSSIVEPISVDFAISDGVVQRSMLTDVVVAFNKTVTLESGAFELLKRGNDGGSVDLISTIDNSGDGSIVTLEFSGQFVEDSGSLEDGNYQLTIDGDSILIEGIAADIDGDGAPGGVLVLGDEEAEEFYRFAGDVDRNRTVNIFDLLGFRQTYLLMTGDASFDLAFDFNLDGFVNIFDLLRFRQNYRGVLPFEDSSSLTSRLSGSSPTKGSSSKIGIR